MKELPITKNEQERLKELYSYKIINELESEDYDFLTEMAAQVCETKIASISFITENKQWFLSHHGLEEDECSKEFSFCVHTINQPNAAFIIEDATKDERFLNNPLVTDYPKIVFYAGIPLVTENGFSIGTLCVADYSPKKLSKKQLATLQLLSNQVIKLLTLRKKSFELQEQNNELNKISALFNESQQINKIGAWEIDLEKDSIFWTAEVYKIYEVSNQAAFDKHRSIEYYHQDDRKAITNAVENAINKGESFDLECRFNTEKNNFKWVRSAGKALRENGKIIKIIGTFQDITQQKESQEKLRISEETFRGNFEHAAIGMALLNEKGQWLKVNKRLCAILGYSEAEFL
ncbi:MAG: PAS domain-containing protein, partial [Flavobacterium sp.]